MLFLYESKFYEFTSHQEYKLWTNCIVKKVGNLLKALIHERPIDSKLALRYWNKLFHTIRPRFTTFWQDIDHAADGKDCVNIFPSNLYQCVFPGLKTVNLEDLGILGPRKLPMRLNAILH